MLSNVLFNLAMKANNIVMADNHIKTDKSKDWSVTKFLDNLAGSLQSWGSGLVLVIGLILIIVAIVKIASGLMSHGKKQVNWILNLAMLFIGGALAVSGGWDFVQNVAGGGKETLDNLGSETIIFYLTSFLK